MKRKDILTKKYYFILKTNKKKFYIYNNYIV